MRFCTESLSVTKLGCILRHPNRNRPMEWRKNGEKALVNSKTGLPLGKVITTVFFYWKGAIRPDFLHGLCTVNAQYYYEMARMLRNWHCSGTEAQHP